MHSPSKNIHPKKTRKGTFSQTSVTQSEVGDFQGGYFVMPDPAATKENDYPTKGKQNHKLERSPARRKHFQSEPNIHIPSSPTKDRTRFDQHDYKKPFVERRGSAQGDLLMTPGSFSASTTKLVPISPKQMHSQYSEYPSHKGSPAPSSPIKDSLLSTSPTSAGKWAGPAFGNAPHPSNLPLPQWTSESSISSSPPVHDGSFLHFQASPSPIPFSSIPVVPFPYVGSPHVHLVQPPSPPTLDQLSFDLRRLLNINGSPMVSNDPILVSANSS